MWTYIVVLVLCAPLLTTQQDVETLDSKLLHDLLEKYDGSARPANQSNEAALVTVNFYLRDVFFKRDTEEFTGMQITFREAWNDPRFKFNNDKIKYLTVRDPKRIWVPDIFFSNSKDGHFHNLMEPNILMRIYPNGDVLYSRRVTLNVRCISDWAFYPLNRVKCPILAASYGYTTDSVSILWKTGDPIQVAKAVYNRAGRLQLSSLKTDYCNSKTNTGEYSCIRADFIFKRHFGPYFMNFYSPSIAAVLLAWLSFWLDKKQSSSLSLSILLLSLFIASFAWLFSIVESPATYVINAANVFTAVGGFFTTYALLHFYLTRAMNCGRKIFQTKPVDKTNYGEPGSVAMKPIMADEDAEKNQKEVEPSKRDAFSTEQICKMVGKKTNRPDLLARMLYPGLYIVFNIIYWAVYNEKDNF